MTPRQEAQPGRDWAGLEALSLGLLLAGCCPALSCRLVYISRKDLVLAQSLVQGLHAPTPPSPPGSEPLGT